MKVQKLETSIDQLTWGFSDVTAEGGTMNLWWDGQSGSVAFQVAK